MLGLLLSKWRLLSVATRSWLLVAVLAAIAGTSFAAGWKIAGWRADAARTDAMETTIEAYRVQLDQARAVADIERAEAAELSGLLDKIRRERDIALEELDARPTLTLTRTITKVLPDETPCTCPALGADFRRLWNDPTDSRPADP